MAHGWAGAPAPNPETGSRLEFYGQPHNRGVTFMFQGDLFFFFFIRTACLDMVNGLFKPVGQG